MRREAFTIETMLDDDVPTLCVSYSGTGRSLRERLREDGTTREGNDLDVAYRDAPGEERDGVIGVSDRITGEFVFEAPTPETTVAELVEAATASGDDEPAYRLRIEMGDGDQLSARKRTLLVYDREGRLNRQRSLIPGGVEI